MSAPCGSSTAACVSPERTSMEGVELGGSENRIIATNGGECVSPERKPMEGVELSGVLAIGSDCASSERMAMDTAELGGSAANDPTTDVECDVELHPTSMLPVVSPELVAFVESPVLGRQRKKEDGATKKKLSFLDQPSSEAPARPLEASLNNAVVVLPVDPPSNSGNKSGLLCINAGELQNPVIHHDGTDFEKDQFFVGGDVIRTDELVGEGRFGELFRTARVGNCSYRFDSLGQGNYLVDLHFAEIMYIHGPPGLRTFDVFIQEEKVVSDLDIYAQVGSNQSLTIHDLNVTVDGSESLVIRFQEVNGRPLICGISIRSDTTSGAKSRRSEMEEQTSFEFGDPGMSEIACLKCEKLKHNYDQLLNAHAKLEKALESIKIENEAKGRECHEAWMALQDLQNELMRKSMHVGSLAFAVEGQVKEKTRWFSALRDLGDKVEILKIEHAELLEIGSEYRSCIRDMEIMARSISTLKDQTDLRRENDEIKAKFLKETRIRRELYNKVLEMKGNIRVFCRCRPLNEDEISGGVSMVVDFESAKDGELIIRAPTAPKRTFKFDAVFSPEAGQDSVFEDTSPLSMSVLDGYNVCIFAYGQTGTGKTFTMEGKENARGVNYKTLEELFRIIKERKDLYKYELSVSVLEVYNEQIRDLLASDSQIGVATKRLEIRQVSDGEHCIPGLVEAPVSNVSEVWEVLKTGSNARAVGATNANEHSSRSHCIHCVMVKSENLISGECTRSKLWLIDLAGSERVAKTDVQGERLKEAQCINKSLSALGDVISALATKSSHVPFRNSKLTHLLQDSLGGDSKALMFVQISPSENDVSETLCSLNFASRVRGIELGPARKQIDSTEMTKNKQQLERAKQEIKVRDIHIKKMDETVQSMEQKMKAKDMANKNLQDKIKELESQLMVERRLARQHIDAKIAEQSQQQKCHQREQPEGVVAFREISNVIAPIAEDDANTHDPFLQLATSDLPRKLPRLKENKLEFADDYVIRKASRLSLCQTSQKIAPVCQNSRRKTLCPLPAMGATASLFPPLAPPSTDLPLPAASPANYDTQEQAQGPGGTPRIYKRSSNCLRRSLQMQKKVLVKPVTSQLQGRRGPDRSVVPAGNAKLMRARRVPAGKAATGNASEILKQKERRWN